MPTFVWVYCLPIVDAFLLIVLGLFLFHYTKDTFSKFIVWKISVGILLFISFALLLFSTVSDRTTGDMPEYNLIPFHSYCAVLKGVNPETLRSIFMNTVLFYSARLLNALCLPTNYLGGAVCC